MAKKESRVYQRTRSQFIRVARELFAERGFQSTTMNAIAERSGKGRRTLYNYFATKDEVYLAVIDEELQLLYEDLYHFVYHDETPPAQKLMSFIVRRMHSVSEVVERNGTLVAEFFNDIATVERARLRFDVLERQLIVKLLRDGVEAGSFRILDLKATALLLHSCLKGMEVPYIRGLLGKTEEAQIKTFRVVKSLILNAIKK